MAPALAAKRTADPPSFLFCSRAAGAEKTCFGSRWIDLVSVTSYHVNIDAHLDTFLAQRKKYLAQAPYPAWTSVSVPKLFFEHEVAESGRQAERSC